MLTAVEEHFCSWGKAIHARLEGGERFFVRDWRIAPTGEIGLILKTERVLIKRKGRTSSSLSHAE
jgi:hypothetical protein